MRKDIKNVVYDFVEIQQRNLDYQSKMIIYLIILLLCSFSANIYLTYKLAKAEKTSFTDCVRQTKIEI